MTPKMLEDSLFNVFILKKEKLNNKLFLTGLFSLSHFREVSFMIFWLC